MARLVAGRRPKIEGYDRDVRLVILRTARYDDAAEEVQFGEMSVFLSRAFVITVGQGVASGLRGARQRLEQRPELLAAAAQRRCGRSWTRWWTITHRLSPGSSTTSTRSRPRFSGAVAPTERIYSLRREATDFYRAIHPLLAVVTAIERATEDPQLHPYLRWWRQIGQDPASTRVMPAIRVVASLLWARCS